MTDDELTSLSSARASLDRICAKLVNVPLARLPSEVQRLVQTYREYPELELQHPPCEVADLICQKLENVPVNIAITLVQQIAALVRSSPHSMAALLRELHEAGRRAASASHQGTCSSSLAEPGNDSLNSRVSPEGRWPSAKVARFILRRITSPEGDQKSARRDWLLRFAERFRPVVLVRRARPLPGLGWRSGRMSFEEFVLQWPCEILLASGLDNDTFIEEAYRAILLRPPSTSEKEQYLRLLGDGLLTRSSFVEDLLIGEELGRLERRLRVVCENRVISHPKHSDYIEMPVMEANMQCFARGCESVPNKDPFSG